MLCITQIRPHMSRHNISTPIVYSYHNEAGTRPRESTHLRHFNAFIWRPRLICMRVVQHGSIHLSEHHSSDALCAPLRLSLSLYILDIHLCADGWNGTTSSVRPWHAKPRSLVPMCNLIIMCRVWLICQCSFCSRSLVSPSMLRLKCGLCHSVSLTNLERAINGCGVV